MNGSITLWCSSLLTLTLVTGCAAIAPSNSDTHSLNMTNSQAPPVNNIVDTVAPSTSHSNPDCSINSPPRTEIELMVFPNNISYHTALERCWSLGASIAEITTPELNARAIELLSKATFPDKVKPGGMINLTDTGSEGIWRWASGQAVNYSNWPTDKPNGGNRANCAGIELANTEYEDGWWSDVSCRGAEDAYSAVFCSKNIHSPQLTCQ